MNESIDEAVNAANEALFHLVKADDILSHAQNWGMVDIFAGGFVTTMIKRSKMKDASKEIELAKDAMNQLSDDLRDFQGSSRLDVDMGDFLGFADYFFDSFAVDLFAQSRINDTRKQVKDAIEEVQGILDGLEEME